MYMYVTRPLHTAASSDTGSLSILRLLLYEASPYSPQPQSAIRAGHERPRGGQAAAAASALPRVLEEEAAAAQAKL